MKWSYSFRPNDLASEAEHNVVMDKARIVVKELSSEERESSSPRRCLFFAAGINLPQINCSLRRRDVGAYYVQIGF